MNCLKQFKPPPFPLIQPRASWQLSNMQAKLLHFTLLFLKHYLLYSNPPTPQKKQLTNHATFLSVNGTEDSKERPYFSFLCIIQKLHNFPLAYQITKSSSQGQSLLSRRQQNVSVSWAAKHSTSTPIHHQHIHSSLEGKVSGKHFLP